MRFLFLLLALLFPAIARAATGDRLDLTGYVQTFSASFNGAGPTQPDLSVWTTYLYFGRFIPGEQEAYEDSKSCMGRSPFSVVNGALQITASKPDAWGAAHCLAGTTATMISGVLTTQHSFSQTYGYFEATLYSATEVSGEWPAFWLLPEVQTPANKGQYPEFDVMERWGGTLSYLPVSRWPNVYQTLHTPTETIGNTASLPIVHPGWHSYGLLWTPSNLTWYVDRVETFSVPFANADPHYMVVDLAIDGRYATPSAPVRLSVGSVAAYALSTAQP